MNPEQLTEQIMKVVRPWIYSGLDEVREKVLAILHAEAGRAPSPAADGLSREIDTLLARTADLARIITTTDNLPSDPKTEPFGSALRREFLALRQGVVSLLACGGMTPPRRRWTRSGVATMAQPSAPQGASQCDE